jgi:prolyl 4-hydroxylase
MNNQLRTPEVDLRGSPSFVNVDGQIVQVKMNMRFPRITVFENFMSFDECELLMDMAEPKLIRSKTISEDGKGFTEHQVRTSSGAAFPRGENAFIEMLDMRAAKLLNWPVERGESYQVMKYEVGQEYKPHFDFFMPRTDPKLIVNGGQRVSSLIIYLNTPKRGGGTLFPEIGLEITPSAGSAVFFSYPNTFFARNTLHAGLPVIEGEKWIATKWMREGPH